MGRPTVIVCARRNCSHCGRWRPISDFGCLRRDPDGEAVWINSWCRACDRARRRPTSPLERLRKAENARMWRRLRAEAEGRTVAAYRVLNPFTGHRVQLESLERYMRKKALA